MISILGVSFDRRVPRLTPGPSRSRPMSGSNWGRSRDCGKTVCPSLSEMASAALRESMRVARAGEPNLAQEDEP